MRILYDAGFELPERRRHPGARVLRFPAPADVSGHRASDPYRDPHRSFQRRIRTAAGKGRRRCRPLRARPQCAGLDGLRGQYVRRGRLKCWPRWPRSSSRRPEPRPGFPARAFAGQAGRIWRRITIAIRGAPSPGAAFRQAAAPELGRWPRSRKDRARQGLRTCRQAPGQGRALLRLDKQELERWTRFMQAPGRRWQASSGRPDDRRGRLRPLRHSGSADRGAARFGRQGPDLREQQRRRGRFRPGPAAEHAAGAQDDRVLRGREQGIRAPVPVGRAGAGIHAAGHAGRAARGGAGIPAFFTRTGVGTIVADGKRSASSTASST